MDREVALRKYIAKHYPHASFFAISGDASFRKYYRLNTTPSRVIMDSDPHLEDNSKFLHAQNILISNSIKVPQIYHKDEKQGFFILEDFGNRLFAHPQPIDIALYKQAIDEIIKLQKVHADVPHYDRELLLTELRLCQEWFNSDFDYKIIFDFLLSNILTHPQVLVHRDFHCRNIMLTKRGLGIIDFQDMVMGSYVYDLVSLLKDVYIELTTLQREELLCYFYEQKALSNWQQFMRDFELVGAQRHIKILGIFSRLAKRDNKMQFLADIPLTQKYLLEMAQKYPELETLGALCVQ